MPVYSIVIPVYNVEKYLPTCLDSIFAQDTTSDYEVILVDDGSPDGSGEICDRYAQQHANIRVIHKKNGGVSAARNTGIEAAQGEYVLFADSDDLWTKDRLSMLDSFLGKQPDMVVSCAQSFTEQGETSELRPVLFPKAGGETGIEYLVRCLEIDGLPVYGAYYYLYRRDMLNENEIRFPEHWSMNEDLDFNMQCFSTAKSIYGVNRVGYLYRLHAASAVHTPSPQKQMMRLEATSKWFRKYSVASFANLFVLAAMSISQTGTRAETKELCRFFQENRDICKAVSDKRCKIASICFRLFGCYSGSVVVQKIIRLRRVLWGVDR